MEITTISINQIIELHDKIITRSGGLSGLSPDKSLDSAIHRIDNHIFYNGLEDIFGIAALYAISLAQGHVFNDGNKRTGLACMYHFLALNNYCLTLTEAQAVTLMLKIAEKKISLSQVTNVIKKHSESL